MSSFLHKWFQLTEPLSQNLSKTTDKCYKIVFIRHGQSEWNQKNQFCGWFDAHLSSQGRDEAKQAGRCLRDMKLVFHQGFTSRLCRAIQTMDIILKELDQEDLAVERHWRLNERHYGNLTGMNKDEARELFGEEKVHAWRRSYATRPPKMLDVNPFYCDVMDGKRFGLRDDEVPLCESLKDTVERVLPYWTEQVTPEIRKGKTLIVAAHGNSLRGIVKHIENISDEGIQHLNLPTGVPFMYTLDANMMAMQGEHGVEFLGDPKKVAKAKSDLQKAKDDDGTDKEKMDGKC